MASDKMIKVPEAEYVGLKAALEVAVKYMQGIEKKLHGKEQTGVSTSVARKGNTSLALQRRRKNLIKQS